MTDVVDIELTGEELAAAIDAYLAARGTPVRGPRTIIVNGWTCEASTVKIYLDPAVVYSSWTPTS